MYVQNFFSCTNFSNVKTLLQYIIPLNDTFKFTRTHWHATTTCSGSAYDRDSPSLVHVQTTVIDGAVLRRNCLGSTEQSLSSLATHRQDNPRIRPRESLPSLVLVACSASTWCGSCATSVTALSWTFG